MATYDGFIGNRGDTTGYGRLGWEYKYFSVQIADANDANNASTTLFAGGDGPGDDITYTANGTLLRFEAADEYPVSVRFTNYLYNSTDQKYTGFYSGDYDSGFKCYLSDGTNKVLIFPKEGYQAVSANTPYTPTETFALTGGQILAGSNKSYYIRIETNGNPIRLDRRCTVVIETAKRAVTWNNESKIIYQQNDYNLTIGFEGGATDNFGELVTYSLNFDGVSYDMETSNSYTVKINDKQIANGTYKATITASSGNDNYFMSITDTITLEYVPRTISYYKNGTWEQCLVYCRVGDEWVLTEPHYRTGNEWKLCSHL